MEERILLLRQEVERRGFKWGEDVDMRRGVATDTNGHTDGAMYLENEGSSQPANGQMGQPSTTNDGRLGDEELERSLRESMEEDGEEDGDGDGIHL